MILFLYNFIPVFVTKHEGYMLFFLQARGAYQISRTLLAPHTPSLDLIGTRIKKIHFYSII